MRIRFIEIEADIEAEFDELGGILRTWWPNAEEMAWLHTRHGGDPVELNFDKD
jgi:hypothetical protein